MAECSSSVQLCFESRRQQVTQQLIDKAIDRTENAPRTCKVSRFWNGHSQNRLRNISTRTQQFMGSGPKLVSGFQKYRIKVRRQNEVGPDVPPNTRDRYGRIECIEDSPVETRHQVWSFTS